MLICRRPCKLQHWSWRGCSLSRTRGANLLRGQPRCPPGASLFPLFYNLVSGLQEGRGSNWLCGLGPEEEERGGWGRFRGPPTAPPAPRPAAPASTLWAQAEPGGAPVGPQRAGPEAALDWLLLGAWANQRPGSRPRPVSRTPRCSAVTSLPLPVVKATRALKINFKEPPSPGA